ncbi:hypothetical protein [Pollutibacter soli]|uniref:hypothetical protein n=1 Tax=Pollutibacter soli TaxID=3034157 RepID=UPI0030134760
MFKNTIFYFAAIIFVAACSPKQTESPDINKLAEEYIRLGLDIGQYDGSFVDAYYGPDSLKPKTKADTAFPKQKFLDEVTALSARLQKITSDTSAAVSARAKWLLAQLKAYERRIKIFSGEYADFDTEAKDLFGVTAPKYDEKTFQQKLDELDKILPGNGSIFDRFQQLANRFIIPKNKIDTVFRTSILECRKRTLAHFTLPGQERFELELVNNKPWSGYNWYKGNYNSLIQINTDINIFIDRAIDVGSHESYPGHHVYNMLLEENLYKGKGLIEISMYPLFSPQSFIAEGSGNYGIQLAFPGDDRIQFSKEVLLPLAGLDTTGITAYFRATAIRGQLNYVRNEVARGLINGTMNETQALEWLMKYGLLNEETAKKSIDFIKVNRTYVINYNYGLEAVEAYVNKKAGTNATEDQIWKAFYQLLSEQIMTTDIVNQ